MTEFYKGSVPCVIGQTTYQVIHPKINDPLSYPIVSLSIPAVLGTPVTILGITNKSTISFDVVLASAPSVTGYEINWQVNIPGTDIAEYVNDKRYYSKEEIGNAKLARVHWKNVISAPDLTPSGLQKNHNHDNRYFSKSEIVPVVESLIANTGSYTPLAGTLALRDASGRTQVNSPRVNADAANKGYVDVKVAGEASFRLAGDMQLFSEVAAISSSYTPLTQAQYLQSQIDALESLVMTISGSGFYSGGAVPVGTIVCIAAENPVLGLDWGYCDGDSLAISSNQELFDVIGYTFGGAGTHFNKPDLRGEFIRGWDDARGLDTGRTFASIQLDELKSHAHSTSTNNAGGHNHTMSIDSSGSHNHTSSMTITGSHTHPVDETAEGSHNHGLDFPIYAYLPYNASGGGDPIGIPNFLVPLSQTQAVGSHVHTISMTANGDHNHENTIDINGLHNHTGYINDAGIHTHSVTVNVTGGESRPHNIAMKFFIKLFTPPVIEPVNITENQSISGQKIFIEPIIVPELPQAIIFGDPLAVGTNALGIIGGRMVVSVQSSAGIWTPVNWLS